MPLIFRRRGLPAAIASAGGTANLGPWSASSTDESGASITPDGFLIYASEEPQDPQAPSGLAAVDVGFVTSYQYTSSSFTSGKTFYFWIRPYEGAALGSFTFLTSVSF